MDEKLIIALIGTAAALLTTLSFLPQVIKTHRTRQTKDLSVWMLSVLAVGVLMWTVYGFLLNEMPLIIANSVTFFLVSYILVMKIKHG